MLVLAVTAALVAGGAYLIDRPATGKGVTAITLAFPMLADPDPDPDTRIASAYRVSGISVHFFIDRSGVLRSQRTGA